MKAIALASILAGLTCGLCVGQEGVPTGLAEAIDPSPMSGARSRGKLLVLAEKALLKRGYKGLDTDQDLRIGDHVHLGVGAAVRAIRPEELTPEQRRAEAARGRPAAWLATEVHGGVRLPFGVSLPVGAGVSVGVGFEPGAKVRYLVLDLHDVAGGDAPVLERAEALARSLGEAAVRVVDLPLDAAEARSLGLGAQRLLEGEAWIALGGSLSLGQAVTTYGEDVVRIGASAVVGGSYRIGGLLRFEVTRLDGEQVRLRVTRGVSHTRSATADLLLGAVLGESAAREAMAPRVEYVKTPGLRDEVLDAAVGAAAHAVRDAVRIHLVAGATQRSDDELELIWRFDLSRPAACEAYQAAVRGDLTAAQARSGEPDSGVVQDFLVNALETRTWLASELRISVLLKAGWSRTSEFSDLDVTELAGKTRYEVFRFSRSRRWKAVGLDERRRGLTLELVRAAPQAGKLRRALRYVLEVVDPRTTSRNALELRRVIASWGLPTGSALPVPEELAPNLSRYGATRAQLVVEIGEEGIAQLLGAGREAWLQAYVQAYTDFKGQEPGWASEWGRQNLDFPGSEDPYQERSELERARDFVDALEALGGGAKTAEGRADAMRALASAARWDPYAITALVKLTPREALRVSASIAGERIAVDAKFAGQRFEAGALFGLPPRDVVRARALEAGAARVDEPVLGPEER